MEEELARINGLGARAYAASDWPKMANIFTSVGPQHTDTHVRSMSPFPISGHVGATSEDGAISHWSRTGGLGCVSSHIQDAPRNSQTRTFGCIVVGG